MKINVQGRDICMQTSVKLLGINIDSNLTFYDYVAKVCRKAAMQINIMKRLGKYLAELMFNVLHNLSPPLTTQSIYETNTYV